MASSRPVYQGWSAVLASVCALVLMSSCSHAVHSSAPTLVSIAVTASNLSIAKGTTEQFTATGTYTDNSTRNLTASVTWSSQSTGVATITAGGLVTAAGAGTSTIQAISGAVVGSTSLTVTPATLVSIAVTAASLSIAKGTLEQFTATGTFSDNSTQNLTGSVTWSSQTMGVATITAGGLATGVTTGTSVIQAASGTIKGSANLTVTSATLVSIAVTAANLSIAKGTMEQFTAIGTFSDTSTQNLTSSVTWSSQTTGVATITAGGLVTAAGTGTSNIKAVSGAVNGSTNLTVTPAALVSIAVAAPSLTIAKGTSEQFTATGTYTDNSTQDLTASVTWSSQTASVATITAGGLVTAAGAGTSNIKATSGAVSGSANLTVTAATLLSIAVTAPSLSIANGTSEQFTATGTYSDGSMPNLTGSVTWSSQSPGVATITTGGIVTAVSTGTSSIKAVLGSVNGSATLTVAAATLVSIAVTPTNPSIGTTGTEQFTATGTYTDNSTRNLTTTVTWSSSNTATATISNTSGTNGLASAVANGTTTIQATLGSVQGSTLLTVTAVSLQVIVVSPQNPSIADNGATQAFTATGHYSDGTTQNLTGSATWTSSNGSVASVNASGLATSATLGSGVNAGFTSIQAAMGSTKGISILSVTNHTSNSIGFAGVFTQHNDISRTGQNLNESILTPANVNTATFGKLFSQAVDGYIYAQPLYVPNVTIAGGTHNVIYVATEGDSVYAFDADSNTGTNGGLLWHASLIDTAHGAAPGATTVNIQAELGSGCTDLVPQVGITSTPVIDPSSGTMYAEAKSKENGNIVHRLHAIDITTGAEKLPGPAQITATVPGTGDGGTTVTLDGLHHLNRPGLLLLNGSIYVAYASHCDDTPYHGWLFAYNASTFTQTSLFLTTPNGSANSTLGGFWMSGAGVAADSNANIFIASGNGLFNTTNVPAQELGDTIMKLFNTGSSRLSLVDYFTPYDQSNLDEGDTDVGSGGVLLLPDQLTGGVTHELVEAGKEGTIYVINRDQMTAGNLHYCQTGCNNRDPQITQEIQKEINGLWSAPAYFNGTVYFCGQQDTIKAFPLSNGLLSTSPSETSDREFPFPGCTPVVSANGNTNGIIWAVDASTYGNAGASLGPAVLYAYQAGTLGTPLWTSSETGNDTAGNAVKFAVPTIANGKVYLGTQTELDVYGTH
jgi:Bacterial Ig-like domain (group 2)